MSTVCFIFCIFVKTWVHKMFSCGVCCIFVWEQCNCIVQRDLQKQQHMMIASLSCCTGLILLLWLFLSFLVMLWVCSSVPIHAHTGWCTVATHIAKMSQMNMISFLHWLMKSVPMLSCARGTSERSHVQDLALQAHIFMRASV